MLNLLVDAELENSNDPIKNLMIAVLEQALKDLNRHHDGKRKSTYNNKTAYDWLNSDLQNSPFSFINICIQLDLNPEITKNKILDYININNKKLKQRAFKYSYKKSQGKD